MPRSSSPISIDGRDYTLELQKFIENLSQIPEKEPVVSEIEVLQSIYGDDAVRLWHSKDRTSVSDGTIRYEVLLSLPSPYEDVPLKILVSLPPSYPSTSPPQLQLLSKYIGAFGADSALFGSILRTYISTSGAEWTEDTVCVFDGLQNVLDRCLTWYEDRLNAEKVGELARDDLKGQLGNEYTLARRSTSPDTNQVYDEEGERIISSEHQNLPITLPTGLQIYVADPITDRRSVFVGRACRISDPSEVPVILSHLMSDRRISRAAHPIINSWRCQINNTIHQDNDDDGESAAGGRLAHLLQILEVNNVLVVVTRYFGGIHLGPDRFRHINQAARNALDLGGFLETSETRKNVGRGKKN
ncbi:ribosomal protein S5 domain 2-like protein [Phlegmacium glaucopus]|nr:ribosomal protein S5 domain 2-like protein [Phlegmacium glaucopus]